MVDRPTAIEARLRVVSVMLEPVFTLARIMGLTLDDLQRLVALGYFREYRLRGLSLRQMSRYLGKSVRTVAELSRSSSEAGPLLDESRHLQWQREVVRAASMGSVSAEEAAALLPKLDEAGAREMLDALVAAGLLEARDGGYVAGVEHVDMVREDLEARLDSLRHFLTAVSHVVYRRFFRGGSPAEAFARVWTFSARREDAAAFREALYETMRNRAIEMDGRDAPDKVECSAVLAVVEPPTDPLWRPRRR